MVVDKQKMLCGGINIGNLIESTYFNQNLVESTCFQNFVKSVSFAMTVVQN